MRRLAVLSIAALIAVLAVSVGVSSAANSGPDRQASGKVAPSKALGATVQKAEKMAKVNLPKRISIYRAVNTLRRKLNKLIKAHNQLVNAFNCMRQTPITQYSGYDYQGNPGATTALDFTEPGTPVSANMMTWNC